MRTTIWTIEGAFGLIGESVRETIDEAILTYKRKVEKMDEKVEKLVRNTAHWIKIEKILSSNSHF